MGAGLKEAMGSGPRVRVMMIQALCYVTSTTAVSPLLRGDRVRGRGLGAVKGNLVVAPVCMRMCPGGPEGGGRPALLI